MGKRSKREPSDRGAPSPTAYPLSGANATVSQVPGQPAQINALGNNPLRDLGGSDNHTFNTVLLNETLVTIFVPGGEGDDSHARRIAATSAALAAFKPTDELEGLLAAQAVALHFGAMECLRRSVIPEQEGRVAHVLRKDGANLARAMTDMLGALDRKRGKGTQVVRVERVVVNEGGQAIVGIAQAGAGQGGRGGVEQSGGEPHAHADNAGQSSGSSGSAPARLGVDAGPGVVLPPLRGADPCRDAVPVACNEQRPLQDARGRQHGS